MNTIIHKMGAFFQHINSPVKALLYLFVTTIIAGLLGFTIGNKIILVLLIGIPAYLLMISLLKNGNRKKAVIYMLLWAAVLGIVMTFICYFAPEKSEEVVIRGIGYRDEMFSWIKTGMGKEGTPSQFIPEHLLHLLLFIVLSVATVSAASILFGTILMNYMAFYVAQLLLYTNQKLLVFIVGWHFWSLFRIAGFVILGVILCEPLLSRILKYKWQLKDAKYYLIASLILIILDITCKAIFAPGIGELMQRLVNI
jgi:hypothetical protein